MAITLLPTSAQERRLNTVFQPRSYAPVVSSQSRRSTAGGQIQPPVATAGGQIQPLLLDLTEKQRFTFFAFAFAAHD
ncbi:hypothetical protein LTSEADE_4503 [Salmonella enterica subsp. enterica serovar Adelaide str. A4-669]|uniref:Uncharacterized protein n=1 Tax=Salmonella enterica subsp. enterica serovar Adelaide str. A4-669 TaxID=913063 RepID=A0A6C8GI36_SALET|nr:hypothetical protein LTSEADE_4503 [Salmonella enterica subsp. enterica serovar Adelaide str. A4-669]